MHRGPAICALVASFALAGCGEGRVNDAPVRQMVHRYLGAMVAHDWATACAQLTREAAARHRASGDAANCPAALALAAGAGLSGVPGVHPERAGEDLIGVRVEIVMIDADRAEVQLRFPRDGDGMFLAVRRGGTWLLAQDLGIGIPVDVPRSGAFD
jgi:hypothetical protein